MTRRNDRIYLAEWGGAASDRAYKDAGTLAIIGPFSTEQDAWEFGGTVLSGYSEYSEYVAPTSYTILRGRIESEVLLTPKERFKERYDNDADDVLDEDDPWPEIRAAALRWCPEVLEEWRTEIAEQAADRERRKQDCDRSGHDWSAWSIHYGDRDEIRHCERCWSAREHRPATEENLRKIREAEELYRESQKYEYQTVRVPRRAHD